MNVLGLAVAALIGEVRQIAKKRFQLLNDGHDDRLSSGESVGLVAVVWDIGLVGSLRRGTGECPAISGREVAPIVGGRWMALECPGPHMVYEGGGEGLNSVRDVLARLAVRGGRIKSSG